MLYGLYQSAQGAQARSVQLDVVANNLANAGTTAFKRQLAVFQVHEPFDELNGIPSDLANGLNDQPGGITIGSTLTDFAQGNFDPTGGPLDLALAGPGFFEVVDGEETFLTRDGSFSVDPQGKLITADRGLTVRGHDGNPIFIPPDTTDVIVGKDGAVTANFDDGVSSTIGRLSLVMPENMAAVERIGENMYAAPSVVAVGSETSVRQGYLEGSGTNPVTETMQMIEASRAFESNVNMIRFQEESLANLLSSMRP
ncbi:flagellar hook-basal body protein [Calycomorphotria hydatis]|uniref:Flagellar basal-body rod protein FlgG n=1 Tax=Calycomorphotria hydatis TaxID=2528027 RepID=A0A517TCN7_9PLAN|nr:flagellar hook basal-body protein [Calycomorphotria hydatis]QDT66136.1 Flagellar basal-body rod protein FlgG [Calycomorphotria hydatis]